MLRMVKGMAALFVGIGLVVAGGLLLRATRLPGWLGEAAFMALLGCAAVSVLALTGIHVPAIAVWAYIVGYGVRIVVRWAYARRNPGGRVSEG